MTHSHAMLSSPTWFCDREIRDICCIGAGFVGGSTGAVLASQLEDINVTVVDINQARIDAWNSDVLPISEPGLDELVQLHRSSKDFAPLQSDLQTSEIAAPSSQNGNGGQVQEHIGSAANLYFTTNVDDSIRKADVVFVCVDTPSLSEDGILGRPLNTRALHKAVRRVGEIAVKDFILVEKCTVPCGTAQQIESILQETVRPGVHFEVLSNPEFLAEGTAIQDLLHPSRVLIGSFSTQTGMSAALTLASVYEQWVPRERILTIDTWSSELSKLAANALLAQRISSINSLSMICESMNADIRTVSKACALDGRIGPHMLNSSVGFGGSCFHKDISYLIYLAASLGLDHVARYWQAVLDMNDQQQSRFSERVARRLGNFARSQSRVAVLGFAFKAKTNDTRNSAAIRVVKDLLMKGFEIAIYDPCVEEADIWSALSDGSGTFPTRVSVCNSSYEACMGACAVVVLTEWDGFRYPLASRKVGAAAIFKDCPPTPDSMEQSESFSYGEIVGHDALGIKHVWQEHNSNASGASEMTRSEEDKLVANVAYKDETQSNPPFTRWEEVAKVMIEPKQVFDGRNIVADSVADLGFRIERIGKMSSFD